MKNKITILRDNRIDLLRAISVIAVVLHHLFQNTSAEYVGTLISPLRNIANFFLNYGQYGVQVFFFVSGVIIARTYPRIESFLRFILFRYSRLIPMLLLASLLDLLVLSFQNNFSFLFVFGFGSSLTLIDPSLLNNIFRTDQFFMFDQAFWTIFIEMAFYILYGIFNTIPIASLKKNSTNFLISYLTVGQMISILLLHFGTKLNIFINYIFFPEWSPYFIMGIFFAKLKSKLNFRQGVYIILITTVITIMVEVRILRVEDHRPNNVIIPTIISLLWIILKSESNLKSFLSKFVGEPSYGTYVLHQNLSIIFFEHIQSQTVKFYSVLFYLMFLLVVCRWIHLQIEAPLIKSLRKHLLGTESRSTSVG